MPIQAELQKLNQDSGLVYLYRIDLTSLDGPVYYFTPNIGADGNPVSFGGQAYTPIPMQVSGWDIASAGRPPKPVITIANVNRVLLSEVVSFKDLIGAKVSRICTLEKYLDGGSDENPTEFYTAGTYVIEQKVSHDRTAISWQLTSIIDRLGMRVPRGIVTKNRFPGVSRIRVR